jgi:class 3 adenylate cyclase
LEKYAPAFDEAEIAYDQLQSLSDADLRELGLPLGPRKRFLEAAGAISPAAPHPHKAQEAERRHLTVMFVDLVGSTALAGTLDPEDMREVLRAYHEAASAEIARMGGMVAKLMGDGVLAYFGWPQAHEDDAERAVRAGLAINAAVARQRAPRGEPLSARTGVATGLVVVGDLIGQGAAQEAAVVGETPNLAARLQSLADPGALVISDATKSRLGETFQCRDLGPQSMKGIAGNPRAFQVLGEAVHVTRFAARRGSGATPLIGRATELEWLMRQWRDACNGGGRVAILKGEAGIGKSHLVEALQREAKSAAHRLAVLQCSPYRSASALHPFAQHLSQSAAWRPGDDDTVKRAKLDRLSLSEGIVDTQTLDFLARVSGLPGDAEVSAAMSPAQLRRETFAAIGRRMTGLAMGSPLLMILEDAHWADESTQDCLSECLEIWANAPVFLLITGRPEYAGRFSHIAAMPELTLSRLTQADCRKVIAHVAGAMSLPDELTDEIARKSDGIPLFIEETSKAVMELGMLRGGDGSLRLERPLSALSVPASLHDSLMSRLDRLAPVKEVAQTASVIGRVFDAQTLAAIAGLQRQALSDALDRLCEAELIFRQGEGASASYVFKHALLRDAAYESMLKSKRQILHRRLYEALQAAKDAPHEVLALHAEAAGLTAEAVTHYRAAGEAAFAKPAYAEAIRHFTQALSLLEMLPRPDEQAASISETELRMRLGLVSIAAKGHAHPDTVAIFEASKPGAAKAQRAGLDFIVWYGLWCGHHVRADTTAAQESAAALHRAAMSVGEPSHLMMGIRALGITALMAGDVAGALARHEEAKLLHDAARDRDFIKIVGQDQSVSFRSYYALSLWAAGQIEAARRTAIESIDLAKRGGHPGSLAYGLMHAAVAAICLRDDRLRDEWIAALIAIATEHRAEMWLDYGRRFDVNRRLHEGDLSALAELDQTRDALERRYARLLTGLIDADSIEALIAMGDLDHAQRLLASALQRLALTHERFGEPALLRAKQMLAQNQKAPTTRSAKKI